MTEALILAAAGATLAGLAGSGHCLAMCGGMAGALGMRAGQASSTSHRLYSAGLYHVGRLTGYALAGALAGALGASTQWLVRSAPLIEIARIASGILMLFVAARLALRWNLLGSIERLGARFWNLVRPLAVRQASTSTPASALLLGVLWGWLPCGLVYSMLLLAAMSQHALSGALILFAYGVGTLPSMLGASVFAGQLQRITARPAFRSASAIMLCAFGLWTIAAATSHDLASMLCATR